MEGLTETGDLVLLLCEVERDGVIPAFDDSGMLLVGTEETTDASL